MEVFNFLNELDTEVPEKCRNCGVQCELTSELGQMMIAKYAAEHFGGHLVGEEGEQFDRFIESVVPEDHVEEARVGIRKSLGETMEKIDNEIETKREKIAANSRACTGPLNMRARKDGVTYVASLCTSARVNIRGTKQHLWTHIRTV
jgi:hypothetical protein